MPVFFEPPYLVKARADVVVEQDLESESCDPIRKRLESLLEECGSRSSSPAVRIDINRFQLGVVRLHERFRHGHPPSEIREPSDDVVRLHCDHDPITIIPQSFDPSIDVLIGRVDCLGL